MRIGIEKDGRWPAEISELPGVMAYGQSRHEAIRRMEALALRVIADRLDHDETIPELDHMFAVAS